MKKIVGVFAKAKKTRENFYSICVDVTSEASTDFSEKNISNSGTYKSFHFDSNCLTGNDQICHENFLTTDTEQKIESSKRSSRPHFDSSTSQVLSEANPLSLGIAYENNESKKKSDSSYLNFKKLNQLNIFENLTEAGQTERNCSESEPFKKENKKTKSSVHVINIHNSRYFHIGPQTTFDMTNSVEENFKSLQDEKIERLVELENLLDSDEKLTEGIIILIALNFEKKWKNFGIYLGFSEDVLDEIEVIYENKILMIYHILRRYIELFPNTSLGFIVSVLKDNCQLNVIQKLVQNKKSN